VTADIELALAADNLANWHATSVAALGCRSLRWPGLWATDGDVPPIFLNAIVLPGGPPAAEQLERLRAMFSGRTAAHGLTVVDYRNELDLRALDLEPRSPRPCFWRPASDDHAPPAPPELEILEVRDQALLAEFEQVSAQGFEAPPIAVHAWHPPAVVDDPRFRVWLGRVDGQPVGGAMAYVGEAVVGVYGVAVAPPFRRHGYGAALTWRATRVEPRLPAALQPSVMGIGVYQRLGYVPIGHFTPWQRQALPPAKKRSLTSKAITVQPAGLHDEHEVQVWVGQDADVFERVAVDDQQISPSALGHHADVTLATREARADRRR
jgi:GNAT superfamily N-acetyltransferase